MIFHRDPEDIEKEGRKVNSILKFESARQKLVSVIKNSIYVVMMKISDAQLIRCNGNSEMPIDGEVWGELETRQ